jgi:bacterioferritin (cytochrome b1)
LPTQVKDNVANSSDNTYVKRVQKHLNDREERVDSIKTKLFLLKTLKASI